MKLKQLITFSILTVSVISCSKKDIIVPQQTNVNQVNDIAITSTSTSELQLPLIDETKDSVYVFIEPQSKQSIVVNAMKNSLNPRAFVGFNAGIGLNSTNMGDLNKYINLPQWSNGTLPVVAKNQIPTNSGGFDSCSNPIVKYNFKTIKFPKGSFILKDGSPDNVWFTFVIPIKAMSGDMYKQTSIEYTYKNKNFPGKPVSLLMEKTIYPYVVYSNGNPLPKGYYRVYTTFTSSALRIQCNNTDDIYFRGNVGR